jgi:hypothetical protein
MLLSFFAKLGFNVQFADVIVLEKVAISPIELELQTWRKPAAAQITAVFPYVVLEIKRAK